MATSPLESFEDAAQRFPGIDQLDPKAIGRFVFFSAGNFPDQLYQSDTDNSWEEPPREEWKDEVSQLLAGVRSWQEERQLGSKVTRYGLAKAAEEAVVLRNETAQLVGTLSEADPDTGFDTAVGYLDKWGFKVGINLAPSGMFPEGRYVTKPVSDFIDREKRYSSIPYGTTVFRSDASGSEGEHLDEKVKDYLDKGHYLLKIKNRVGQVLESLPGIDREELAGIREQYGAKSANLIAFKKVLDNFYEATGEDDGIQRIEIPPYLAVATDMFDAWSSDRGAYETMVENARQGAIELASKAAGGLVAIRSSAVYSEDGEEHTGAGVYKSVVVDPNDQLAFAEGIQAVYESVSSADALAYQASCGVENERMGLLLQTYVEESREGISREAYGFINSRGVNPNIIEVHTPVGTLLFDKPKLVPSLFLDRWHDSDDYLHSRPDHSKELRHMPNQVTSAVHAAIFAELLFQSPVQLEYVSKGQVVQVRPLPSKTFENADTNVVFPEDLDEIVRTKSIGTGDVVLQELDDRDDNTDKEGFVIFWSEYGFTDTYNRSHHGLDSLPRKGAVVILNHSDSGHIQTLCQEKGLMCFYPDSKSDGNDELKAYLDDTRDDYSGDDFDGDFDEPTAQKAPRKLRFVADGYNGRIYSAE